MRWGLGEEKKKGIWVEPDVGCYTKSSWECLWGLETHWEYLPVWEKSFQSKSPKEKPSHKYLKIFVPKTRKHFKYKWERYEKNVGSLELLIKTICLWIPLELASIWVEYIIRRNALYLHILFSCTWLKATMCVQSRYASMVYLLR